MKNTIIVLVGILVFASVAYIVLQTTWLLIGLVIIGLVLLILGVFFAGVYVARDMMQKGAGIALEAQQLNDQWDAAKMAGLANFGKEVIKIKSDSISAGQQYPALPPMTPINGEFTIAGFDGEEIEQ